MVAQGDDWQFPESVPVVLTERVVPLAPAGTAVRVAMPNVAAAATTTARRRDFTILPRGPGDDPLRRFNIGTSQTRGSSVRPGRPDPPGEARAVAQPVSSGYRKQVVMWSSTRPAAWRWA